MKLGPREELEAAGDLLDAKRRASVVEQLLQALQSTPGRGGVGEAGNLGQLPGRQGLVGEKQRRLDGGRRLVAGQGIGRPGRRRVVAASRSARAR